MRFVSLFVTVLLLSTGGLAKAQTTKTGPPPPAKPLGTNKVTDKPSINEESAAAHTCKAGWQTVSVKISGSRLITNIVSLKDGSQQLEWPKHKLELVTTYIGELKGPINRNGEVEMCRSIINVFTFTDSNVLSLKDLITSNKLQPGYYALRIKIGDQNVVGEYSDWVIYHF